MGILDYLSDTKGELKHVTWPTRRQTTLFTILVIIISLITAFFLGAADFGFSKALEWLLSR